MSIFKRTAGVLAAAVMTFSCLPASAEEQSAADTDVGADTYSYEIPDVTKTETENNIETETDSDKYIDSIAELAEDGVTPGENVELPESCEEEEFAEDFAQRFDDPQYGRSMNQDTAGSADLFSANSRMAEPGGGGSLIGLDKYSNGELTHNSRFDGLDRVYGIDVSYFQYDIDWEKVATEVDFAIIRVGYRGYGSAGDLVLDYKFKENITEAKAAGLEVGVYFYTQAINSEEAREEADFVCKYLKGYELDLPVYYDIESVDYDEGRLDNADLSVAQKTQLCKAFCNRIIKNGYEAGVYANMNWLYNEIDGKELGEKYPIWLAHYTDETSYTGDYQTWQFSSTGKISGISTNVDMNVNYREPAWRSDLYAPENFKYKVNNGVATFSCDPVEGADRYQLCAVDKSGNYTRLMSSSQPQMSLSLTDTYTGYAMRAADTSGDTNYFGAYSPVLYAQKGMPANAYVSDAVGGAVKCTWDLLDGATSYSIYRADGKNAGFKLYRTVGKNTHSIRETNLKKNTCYGYRVVPNMESSAVGYPGVATVDMWYVTEISKVAGVRVSSASSNSITLKWSGLGVADRYEVALYDSATGKYTKKATASAGATSITVTGLQPRTAYTFAVRAVAECGGITRYGEYSLPVNAQTALAAPDSLYATADSSGVKLTWKKASGAIGYRIYRKTTGGFVRIAEISANKLSYTDKKVPDTRTVYTVKALYNVNGKKTLGNSAKNVAVNNIPYAPTAYHVRSTKSRIRISWTKVSNCSGYRIYRYDYAKKKYYALKTVNSKNSLTYVASGLPSGTKCKFKVRPFKNGVRGITWGKCSKYVVAWTK